MPKFEGYETFKGYPTTLEDGRMKELTFRVCGWVGMASHNSVYSRDCKRGQSTYRFSANKTIRYQRETQLTEDYVSSIKADYPAYAKGQWNKPAGYDIPLNSQSVLEVGREDANIEFQRAGNCTYLELMVIFF